MECAGVPVNYRDHGLVFCKEWGERRARKDFLGDPLQTNNLGEREFLRLIKAAGVKRISIHGLRHTSATLLLKAGVPAHVVQHRLGHKRIEMTLGTYARALPSMQRDAAQKLNASFTGSTNLGGLRDPLGRVGSQPNPSDRSWVEHRVPPRSVAQENVAVSTWLAFG